MKWHIVLLEVVVNLALVVGVAVMLGACGLTYDLGKGCVWLDRNNTPSASSCISSPPTLQGP
jgi:hypothetical protein